MEKKVVIELEGMSFKAYHGVYEQERKVGNIYRVDLRLHLRAGSYLKSDHLADTISYAEVYSSVAEEMETPSQLIEHAAYRILERLHRDFPRLLFVELRLSKKNPPIKGVLEAAAVCLDSSLLEW